jgi:Zn-dependent protease with chaperone function
LVSGPSHRISALVLAAALGATSASALPPGSTPREIELGRQAAEDIQKTVHLVQDEETLAKLQAMLDEIAAVTDRPEIRYQPHLVASPLPNAFVIPGGWVYVTTAMLDVVESDDELAGVLAHEIAHNVNQHAIERMRSIPRGLGLLQLASIAALIIGQSPEAAILAGAAANHITASVLHGSSVAAEVEADAYGIDYLTRTEYDPTGFLTVWERFAGSSGKFIEEELGIYATHPLTRDRVHAARDRLEELGVPILRRLVTHAPQPESRALSLDGEDVTEIRYVGERLALLEGQDADRGEAAIASIAWILDHELDESRIKVIPARNGVVFQPEGGPSFSFTHGDGRLNGAGEAVLAGELRTRLTEIVADEQARVSANYHLY